MGGASSVLGFDSILIALTDGSDRLLAAMNGAGYISDIPNSLKPGEIPQHAGHEKIRGLHDMDGREWLMLPDAGEFLNVNVGTNRVSDLTDNSIARYAAEMSSHSKIKCRQRLCKKPSPLWSRPIGWVLRQIHTSALAIDVERRHLAASVQVHCRSG